MSSRNPFASPTAGAERATLRRAARARPLRRVWALILLNSALWSVGNALTAGTLLLYLALDLGASGLMISIFLAAPTAAGLLRLFAPLTISWFGGHKRAFLLLSLAAYTLLIGQPIAAISIGQNSWATLTGLAILVCCHQLLEYLALSVQWAWLGDLTPKPIRGRFFALRNIVSLAAYFPALYLGSYVVDYWRGLTAATENDRLFGYAVSAGVGVLFLFASLLPMACLPDRNRKSNTSTAFSWRRIIAPLSDRAFRRLVYFGAWVGAANGLTQSAQNIYPARILGMAASDMAILRTTMRLGQIAYSPGAGWLIDRFGVRGVLIVSQTLVSCSLLFFLFAEPRTRWLLLGAWLFWSAFAGLNIGLPTACLNYSRRSDHAAYVAMYFGLGGVAYAVASVLGGFLLDVATSSDPGWFVGSGWSTYQVFFAVGFVLRLLGVLWLLGLPESRAVSPSVDELS